MGGNGARPLDVLVVVPAGVLGGAERWLLTMLDNTDRLAVSALLLEDGPVRGQFEGRGIPVTVCPVSRRPAEVVRTVWRLQGRLRWARPQVVLSNGVKAQAVAGPVSFCLRLPTVWVKHDHRHDRWLAHPLGRLTTRVVATCRQVGEPVRRADVTVLEPPRPPPPLPRPVARGLLRDLGVSDDGHLVLMMITQLVPYKGVDTALRALATPEGRSWRVAVIGDEPRGSGERARLTALASDLGVLDRVCLCGPVPEAGRLLSAADAVAVLTRPGGFRAPWREGASMVAMEAMAAAVPAIAPDDGGAAVERLRGEAGLGVDPSDSDAVARALATLSDGDLRTVMGRAGSRIISEYPDAHSCAALLVAELEQAAGLARAGRRAERLTSRWRRLGGLRP